MSTAICGRVLDCFSTVPLGLIEKSKVAGREACQIPLSKIKCMSCNCFSIGYYSVKLCSIHKPFEYNLPCEVVDFIVLTFS